MRSRAVNLAIVAAAVALLAVGATGLLLGATGGGDRAYELETRLRCPVCTSVSVAESQSDTAVAMRRVVTEQVAAGRSDAEIIDYFRARYGDWVLIDPPARGRTGLLWLLPAVAAVTGLVAVLARTRRGAAVTGERDRLGELADQALRDITELERQIAEGEIPAGLGAELRHRYEVTAAHALAELDRAGPPGGDAIRPASRRPASRRPASRRSRARVLAYAVTALAAVVAAAVLLPQSVGERPGGGFVTGNEIGQAAPGPLTRDPATISDAELEAVVAQNPGVVGMRLALAERYVAQGNYARAGEHYSVALRREPGNVEAQAHFGWLLLQLGRPVEALEWVDRALAAPQPPLDALWFRANIALHGLDDPATALATLQQMRQRPDVSPTVAQQIDELAEAARKRQHGADR